ncbi:hypothetical protein [uncultured Anaeromusa sp.]|uniref:hypothetical protein n=1 Tax=uncultured Anaeromusa sp. TaxID=673273 RepID=UPI0029C92C63|nr:hypothetical protein [uncultured Anaeromusa sp.]
MAIQITNHGSYGDGSLGDVVSPNIQKDSSNLRTFGFNSYAAISGVSADGKTITISYTALGDYEKFDVGNTVVFHVTGCLTSETTAIDSYCFAKILSKSGTTIVLDKSVSSALDPADASKYVCQLITVPQFNSLTLDSAVSNYYIAKPRPFDSTNKIGGVLILNAKTKIDFKAGAGATGDYGGFIDAAGFALRPAGITRTHADLANGKLPVNQGGGAVLLISPDLKLTPTSILGNDYGSYAGGGRMGNTNSSCTNGASGYGGGGGYGSIVGGSLKATAGRLGQGGDGVTTAGVVLAGGLPGYAGATASASGWIWAYQWGGAGSSVLAIAETIEGFTTIATDYSQTPFATGGQAGFHGGGNGSAGGGPGFCCIATNTSTAIDNISYALVAVSANKTILVYPDAAVDLSTASEVNGITILGDQPSGSDRRLAFKLPGATQGVRTYPITTNAVAADTVTICGVTFTAIASGATGNQFNVGATIAATATNLVATMNANATFNALYAATVSDTTITVTEKIAGGHTPTAATKTGTIVIGTGTSVTSVASWFKLTGSGTVTLTPLTTQNVTIDSLLSEGNTVAEVSAATSIPGFVSKTVTPIIALVSPKDAATLPTIKLNFVVKSSTDQTNRSEVSAPITLAAEAVELIDLSAAVTATGGAAAIVTVALEQNGSFGDYMPLTNARRQKATAIKFKADYSVASIGTGSAKVTKASATYRTNNSAVSGDAAEMVTVTEDFGGVGMRAGRMTVKHQVLRDAQISAQMAMRPVPKTRERIPIAAGTGNRQTVVLGVKDETGNVVADPYINHNTLRVWYGSQEIFDFDYNTQLSQASVTPPDGVTAFASYSYGWEPETWVEMTKGTTQTHDDPNVVTTEFSYALGSSDSAKGIAAAKVLLKKPTGSASQALGSATGKTQMFVLDHLAKLSALAVTASTGTASWSYDEDSRILTVAATKDAALTATYDWVAETPVCTGFVAAWNE